MTESRTCLCVATLIASTGDPDEKPWEPLSPETIRTKGQKGMSRPEHPLFATGFMRKSIGVIRGQSVIAVASGAGFKIGITDNKAGYGRFHQLGIGVVQRRFLGINAKDVKAVDSLLRRAMLKAVERG
jgi:hypothetical protein